MQTLTLLRHAKAGYVDGLTDFKRHLTETGRRDVLNIAIALRARNCIPTSILVSSAVRTRETAQILSEAMSLDSGSITHLLELYLATPEVLIREINHAGETSHLMLIGHNPGLETLSNLLDSSSPERMTTCSVNHFLMTPLTQSNAAAVREMAVRDTHKSGASASTTVDLQLKTPTNEVDPDPTLLGNRLRARLQFHQTPPD